MLEPLTGRRLKLAVMNLHDGATGLDGWSAADLRRLPDTALEILADIWNRIEEGADVLSASSATSSLVAKGLSLWISSL